MNYSAKALNALTPSQILFLEGLPKAELHAHLNGSIPVSCLEQLAKSYKPQDNIGSADVTVAIQNLSNGVQLNEIDDFFKLFPGIYALTSDVHSLGIAARAVLNEFLEPRPSASGIEGAPAVPQCNYLELRSTPRATPQMTRLEYVQAVLGEVEKFPADKAAFILSVDRRMSRAEADEVVDIAIQMKNEGRRIVGVDLCGSPMASDVTVFGPPLTRAREAGLGLTIHIAETFHNSREETLSLLELVPAEAKARLGHATFLDPIAQLIVLNRKLPIEICLSSNFQSKTVLSIEVHHINDYVILGHPVAISTDDILPFKTSLLAEYALLMAPVPLGLGLSEDEVRKIAAGGWNSRFASV
ncbi:adenosine deaminase [Rhizoctonia solani AG-3 Rhs1AP]|uniref:Adenosine deaminase n=2 Tax=Rhizoctonia solani AG-3 TaxID=1086053 RepID=A0A074SLP6_9AGAM|nr:adenosine deaminase [Rhizoctonia solani AG-3 Rhs1AP]KEP51007.1 adenosine deaminase [Rhizoctonia solani 123E]